MADVTVSHTWSAYDTFALLGGLVIAGALVPGLARTIKKGEYAGISYTWQVTYIVGLSTILAYAIHYSLWAILIPNAIEIGELLVLTIFKIHYDLTNPAANPTAPVVDKKKAYEPGLQLESSKRAGIRPMRFGSKSFDRRPPPEPATDEPLTSPSPSPDIESAAGSGRKSMS